MTDPTEMTALDQRARAAVAALQGDASARPRPAFDPDRRSLPTPAPPRR